MAQLAKFLSSTAGVASGSGGAGLDVDEVFNTFVADATGSGSLTINNGIDLSGEGGIVWVKSRNNAHNHYIFDTNVGSGGYLQPNNTASGLTGANYSFTSTGLTDAYNNYSGNEAVWWTFRKAPKFCDIVTYTGNGPTGTSSDTPQTISHNLGSVPGMIIVKKTSGSSGWFTFHRSTGSSKYLRLNATSAASNSTDGGAWGTYDPTSTDFKVGYLANDNGASYVAYLFAHNNSDGDFGPDSDQDVIKCGSYTGTGAAGNEIDLGFEPQWLMTKSATGSENWIIQDNMRSMTDTDYAWLRANLSDAEIGGAFSGGTAAARPTGFVINNTGTSNNGSGSTYIYMAIRRGPLAAPESATDVFAIDTRGASEPAYDSGFPVDLGIIREANSTGDWFVGSRLIQGKYLQTNTTSAEASASSYVFDYMDGWNSTTGSNSNLYSWMWKRAPSFFDVVAYTGTGSARTVSHNLGVVPEMMWVKPRETGLSSSDWWVFHKDLSTPADDSLVLNSTGSENTGNGALLWNSTMPTSSVFSLGTYNGVNQSGRNYIAYLFASSNVSKVGSYVGNNTDGHQIDCGFSSGARFVLIKNTTVSATNWLLFDTARGIVAGNDARLYLNTADSQNSGTDYIDPYSSGFELTANAQVNFSGSTYIFYAIA